MPRGEGDEWWCETPQECGYGWWRGPESFESFGIFIHHEVDCLSQLGAVRDSVGSFFRMSLVIVVVTYIVNLAIFDTYGHFHGGPYDYGVPFWASVGLLTCGFAYALFRWNASSNPQG